MAAVAPIIISDVKPADVGLKRYGSAITYSIVSVLNIFILFINFKLFHQQDGRKLD